MFKAATTTKQYHSFIELCPVMLFVVTACAGENERRSQERAADIGGISSITLSLNQLSCALHVMLFVVTACAGENKRRS